MTSLKSKHIAITGHSSGIGAALFDYFSKSNNVVHGFSRSNGFDLSKKNDYQRAWSTMKGCDIVINNAYSSEHRYLQTDILNDFVEASIQDEKKIILNMGSMSPYVNKSVLKFNEYASSKVLLADSINRLKTSGHKCGIISVSPGWVKTPMYDNFKKAFSDQASDFPLSASEIVDQVTMLIDLFYLKNINVYMFELKRMR